MIQSPLSKFRVSSAVLVRASRTAVICYYLFYVDYDCIRLALFASCSFVHCSLLHPLFPCRPFPVYEFVSSPPFPFFPFPTLHFGLFFPFYSSLFISCLSEFLSWPFYSLYVFLFSLIFHFLSLFIIILSFSFLLFLCGSFVIYVNYICMLSTFLCMFLSPVSLLHPFFPYLPFPVYEFLSSPLPLLFFFLSCCVLVFYVNCLYCFLSLSLHVPFLTLILHFSSFVFHFLFTNSYLIFFFLFLM